MCVLCAIDKNSAYQHTLILKLTLNMPLTDVSTLENGNQLRRIVEGAFPYPGMLYRKKFSL